jgi:branched-chain amino acid transport system ATP-binding protein
MLEISNLVAGYGGVPILRGVSLSVGAGEIVAVLGANGVGKTTLNRAVSGLIRASSGDIRFDGQSLIGRSAPDLSQHERV